MNAWFHVKMIIVFETVLESEWFEWASTAKHLKAI